MNGRTVRVTLVVWAALFRQAVMRDLQFRSQAWLHVVSSVGELVVGVLPVVIITGYAGFDPAIAAASLLTVGAFGVTTGLMDSFVTPGLRRFDSAVRRGELDFAIIRPVPTFLYAVMRWVQPAELAKCVTGLAILLTAGVATDLRPGPGAVLAMVVWALVGTVVYCTFWADLALLALWVRSIEPVNDLVGAWRGAGQYPRQFFPRTVQVLLVSAAPAALGGSFPAEQLLDPSAALGIAPLLGIASCTVTSVVWRRGLARYDSASS